MNIFIASFTRGMSLKLFKKDFIDSLKNTISKIFLNSFQSSLIYAKIDNLPKAKLLSLGIFKKNKNKLKLIKTDLHFT